MIICVELFAIVVALSSATLASKSVARNESADSEELGSPCEPTEYFSQILELKNKEIAELERKIAKTQEQQALSIVDSIDSLNNEIKMCEKALDSMDHQIYTYKNIYINKISKVAELQQKFLAFEKEKVKNESILLKSNAKCQKQLNDLQRNEQQLSKSFHNAQADELQDLDEISNCKTDTYMFENEMKNILDPKSRFILRNTSPFKIRYPERTCSGNALGDDWFQFYSLENVDSEFKDLDRVSNQTLFRQTELYVNVIDNNGTIFYARYDDFIIADRIINYKLLSLGKYSGNAGDILREYEGNYFSTKNTGPLQECAELYNRSWWYGDCILKGSKLWLDSVRVANPIQSLVMRISIPKTNLENIWNKRY